MNVGIIAHNSKKALIEDFCIAYKNIVFHFYKRNVVLLEQTICQHINIFTKRAYDSYSCNVIDVFLNRIYRQRNILIPNFVSTSIIAQR